MAEWRTVKGFERYLVSDTGDVRSTIRGGRVLKAYSTPQGYKIVSLMADGASKAKKQTVHRLVAEAFLSGTGETVNHIDGDKANNSSANLEWCSYAENNEHAKATGLSKNFGQNHRNAKLSVDDVREIRRLRKSGMLHKDIAAKFGVGRRAVGKILTGSSWSRVS